MRAYVEIGGSEALTLKGALLLYQGRNRVFVSWHELRQSPSGGAPYLGEAQEITTEFVHRLAQGLGTQIPVEVLPENVVVRTAETLMWWTPRTVHAMFFRATDEEASELSGKRFPQPPLVWKVTGKDLWVRALAGNRRPTADTKLMTAPYWNVDGETGWTCQGSMRSPEEPGTDAIPLWEKAFFQSEFTHQTGPRRLTTHPGGFFGLWRELAGRKLFPGKYLAPGKESLKEFAKRER
jgi:PRTRC genetic system protein B